MRILSVIILLFFGGLFNGCGSRSSDFGDKTDLNNPLQPCPDTPNCIRIAENFATSPDRLYSASISAIETMQPSTYRLQPEEYRIEAVFTVVFFNDDMIIQAEPHENGSTLFIRSASRVGSYDFGVNRKRVEDFLDKIVLFL